ncbi:MAG TPA: 50S ribosomal protein L29 [Patescibacteria group bacterium]|nr:50S ribosomal protein L29 [Patescibacteria group bacterium]
MKFKDLKNKTKEDLQKILHAERDKLRDLRFKDSNKQLKNVKEIKDTRTSIAQILTKLKQITLDKE